MKIVIIEDEMLTAEDLRDVILQVEPTAEIVAALSSVAEAVEYFQSHEMPQLIFSDIQLGDGLSFDIFNEVAISVPVIFCTAYDEYAMKAFNANGIHYVLKPFNAQKIQEAFEKYNALKSSFNAYTESLDKIIHTLSNQQESRKTNSILVHYQNSVIPIKIEDIALFYIKHEICYLYKFDQKSYMVNKSLDELQQIDEDLFYRANRQFIVNRNAVKEVLQYLSRKVSIELTIPFDESITISKEKITSFYTWLAGE